MNDQELTKAVWQDHAAIIQASTLTRLHGEYDRERRKKKVPADSAYPRCYPIRTKAKNNWLIFLLKTPLSPKYRGTDDISFYPVVYYFGPKGFTVFKPDTASGMLFVYQGHVFTRYSQRMQLELSDPVEKIQHFFTYNACADHHVKERKARLFSIGICRDGALLGDYRDDLKWILNRTFVNRDVFYRYQQKAELQTIKETTATITKAMNGQASLATAYRNANIAHAIFCS